MQSQGIFKLLIRKAQQPAQLPAEQTAQGLLDEGERQQTREEQLAGVNEDENDDSDGEECELHVYERRVNTHGEEVYLRTGTKAEFEPLKRRSHRACLVLKRYYHQHGEPYATRLEIQSKHIIKALRKVIGTYYGVDFTRNLITVDGPPRFLFHYQDELRQYAESSNDHQLNSHMQLCLQYVEKTLYQEIRLVKSIRTTKPGSLELEHRHLWMLYKPGSWVYHKSGGFEEIFRLRSIYSEDDDDEDEIDSWILDTEYIGANGNKTDVGFLHQCLKIGRYEGCRRVGDLHAVPLPFHPEEARIQDELLKRGRKFLSLLGIHNCCYDDPAIPPTRGSPQSRAAQKINVRHRIMLDIEHWGQTQGSSEMFVSGTNSFISGTEALSKLSDEEIMTCPSSIVGYSLESKRWDNFAVEKITDIAYNDKAFDGLVLSETKKRLISSLLEGQDDQQDDEFDDLITGKGKGLIFLLHGPPGVGKTYTAESIADHTRRPLLKVSSGELCGPGGKTEQLLSKLLILATRWNGILLLDEADVFMQERTLHNLETNQLVSILLRVLEYYEGIIFLTTNRVETIDHAFKSRIHLSIAYPPLSADARRELWNSFVMRANRGQLPEWLTTEFLNHLVEQKVNGREIKNIVRVGYSLARNAKRDLQSDDLLQALDALMQFDADFGKWKDQGKTVNAIE